jgi:hypothetical protein
MKLRKSLVGVVLVLSTVGSLVGSGGTAQAAKAGVRFSSVYTTIAKDCKSDGPEENDNGSDTPLICKGAGKYKLSIGYSAFGATLSAAVGENFISLGEVDGLWDQSPGRKLEWRLANGKPFAAIYRVNTYRNIDTEIAEGRSPWTEANRTGSRIVVVGLEGYETLKGEFPGKDAKANAKARALVDAAYAKG